MSRAYLFIETGEVRKAHNEWRLEDGDCLHSIHTDMDYPILARHEIEIPEKFTEIKIIAGSLCDLNAVVRIFPIPHPKKKVKKCQYITIGTDHCGRKRGEVTGWLTNKEAMERGLEPEDRIYQTEIEVEE